MVPAVQCVEPYANPHLNVFKARRRHLCAYCSCTARTQLMFDKVDPTFGWRVIPVKSRGTDGTIPPVCVLAAQARRLFGARPWAGPVLQAQGGVEEAKQLFRRSVRRLLSMRHITWQLFKTPDLAPGSRSSAPLRANHPDRIRPLAHVVHTAHRPKLRSSLHSSPLWLESPEMPPLPRRSLLAGAVVFLMFVAASVSTPSFNTFASHCLTVEILTAWS
jgi:hypothetical protein